MINLSLCFFFNLAPRYESVLGEYRYSSTHSFTSALDCCECSASRHGRFTPKERAPGTHWIGGWVGPRTVLNAVVKRKIPIPAWTVRKTNEVQIPHSVLLGFHAVFSSPPSPDRFWGPPSLLSNGYWWGALSERVRRSGHEADHSPPSSVEVKNAWDYTSTPTIHLRIARSGRSHNCFFRRMTRDMLRV
jgi:hypothetical protein